MKNLPSKLSPQSCGDALILSADAIKNIVRKLLVGDAAYAVEIEDLHDCRFASDLASVFVPACATKIRCQSITLEWFNKEAQQVLKSNEKPPLYRGLTSQANQVDTNANISEWFAHHRMLRNAIRELPQREEANVKVTFRVNQASIELDLDESLIVINTLAVKRAALRGGVWSTAGKQAEKPLMITLCRLFRVPSKYYDQTNRPKSRREIDFYLKDGNLDFQPCEVKLMGKGNPESLKSALVRIREAKDEGKSFIFVADTLSAENREDLIDSGALWVELNVENGHRSFARVLEALKIPYKPVTGNLSKAVDRILAELSDEEVERMATEAAKKVEASANEAAE